MFVAVHRFLFLSIIFILFLLSGIQIKLICYYYCLYTVNAHNRCNESYIRLGIFILFFLLFVQLICECVCQRCDMYKIYFIFYLIRVSLIANYNRQEHIFSNRHVNNNVWQYLYRIPLNAFLQSKMMNNFCKKIKTFFIFANQQTNQCICIKIRLNSNSIYLWEKFFYSVELISERKLT